MFEQLCCEHCYVVAAQQLVLEAAVKADCALRREAGGWRHVMHAVDATEDKACACQTTRRLVDQFSPSRQWVQQDLSGRVGRMWRVKHTRLSAVMLASGVA